jgi:hypothetical protein
MDSWSTAAPPPPPPRRERSGASRVLLLGAVAGILAAVALGALPSAGSGSPLPPPVVDGSAGYRFIHLDARTGLPSRFDPCTPVRYVINPDGAPTSGVEDVQEAFRRAELATGIRFVYEGAVDEVPSRGRRPYQPERYGERWAPVLVGWSAIPPEAGEGVAGAVVGWASHTPLLHHRQDVVTTGTIALDAGARSVRPGFGAGRRWGNVVLHEIGHLLGLDPEAGCH